MQDYVFKYGKEKLKFSLDPSLVAGELKIKDCPVLSDPEAAIRQALAHPIGSKPLREIVKPGETVVFIVNDPTRVANSHVFMPILLDEMNAAGIPDKDMAIIFALGTHRLMTDEEMVQEVGEAVAKRVKMHNSDAKDSSQFTYFGETSRGTPVWFNNLVVQADHIICTGSIVHHFFAGFGGGRKAMLPGVSAYETIRKNHSMIFDPNALIGKLEGNPIYHDQVEGVEMHRPSFLLNVVLNEKKEFLAVFAGDYIQAHLEGCKLVDEVYGAELEEPADLVIATCGGFPKDINVYQMQKTMDNAWVAVRDGGVVILLGECIEGTGSATYEDWMREYQTPDRIAEMVKANFQIGAHKAYAVTRLMKKAEFILVSAMEPEFAKMLLFTPAKDMEEALAMAFAKLGPKPRIVLMPQGSLTVPRIRVK
ncbi:transcriptional regulator [Anaerosporomusa subterranea]|uniref:Transcriptional regulator n=1 Tax=Anaerosporomusa subterranea TaxID=1794912 RepID=A0A154BLZ4_ANASB|nr:nickel-dependent lactate racemase [Anaerosporomusa subterranea]KYZ74994.1 transcriptional regulator [Anaerosporomusa subterranea]